MTDSGMTTDPTYRYRPSVFGAPSQFRLAQDALFWDIGSRSGSARYRDIQRVRMSYRPVTMQNHRFITEIWLRGTPRIDIASTSWKSLAEQERLDTAYSAFITELHRRIAHSGAVVSYETGGNPLRYWAGLAVFVAVSLGLAALVVLALGLAAWGGVALTGGFLVLFLWQVGNYFRRNRPGSYRPEALPGVLVP